MIPIVLGLLSVKASPGIVMGYGLFQGESEDVLVSRREEDVRLARWSWYDMGYVSR